MKNNFYVYIYFDPRNGLPIYVGKGHGDRAWRHLKSNKINNLFFKKLRKIENLGLEAEVIIFEDNLLEQDAFNLERNLIAHWGRINNDTGSLCNMTNGGEGNSGLIYTKEHRQKLSEQRKGKKFSEEHRKKISEARKGKKWSDDMKLKLSSSCMGRVISEETKRKISEANTGRIKTEEELKKISVAHKGKKHTEESRKKMSEAKKGKPSPRKGKHHTEEAKQKLREANIGKHIGELNNMYGVPSPMTGKHHTGETKKKQSELIKLAWKRRKGENLSL